MRLFLGLAFGVTLPFATVYLAVLVVSLVYGAPAGIFTILLSLVAANWTLEPPYFSFTPMTGEMMVNFAFFAGVSLAIVAIASHRRSLTRQLLEERATIELLMAELQHRSKNQLSVVQAIIAGTLRGDSERIKQVSDRIKCLADADDVVAASVHLEASLKDLAERELKSFTGLTIEGPYVLLSPPLAKSVALILQREDPR